MKDASPEEIFAYLGSLKAEVRELFRDQEGPLQVEEAARRADIKLRTFLTLFRGRMLEPGTEWLLDEWVDAAVQRHFAYQEAVGCHCVARRDRVGCEVEKRYP